MEDYELIYNYSNEIPDLTGIGIGLLLTTIFMVVFVSYIKNPNGFFFSGIFSHNKVAAPVVGFFGSIFGTLWTIFVGYHQLTGYLDTNEILNKKEYKVVEGLTQDFDPMPHSGHKNESFTVNDIEFSYSDFGIIDGYNNTCSHGGAICGNNIPVRISYTTVKGENRILILEIKRTHNKS